MAPRTPGKHAPAEAGLGVKAFVWGLLALILFSPLLTLWLIDGPSNFISLAISDWLARF